MRQPVTKEELKDWRELDATRFVLDRVTDFRNQTFIGVLSVGRDKRDEQIDLVNGMDMVIEMLRNIHMEGEVS